MEIGQATDSGLVEKIGMKCLILKRMTKMQSVVLYQRQMIALAGLII